MAAIRLGVPRGLATNVRTSSPHAIKRTIDLGFGLTLALLALPLMASIAVAIMLDSPGPALYRPKRVGRGGSIFSMYKFRTMVDGAEDKLKDVAHMNVASGMVKIPNDPRVTRVGKVLRRFSLDELPQLYNVVLGHMSLVGPRPHDVHEIATHNLEHDPRLAMRPGLTGLWQVKARTDPRFERRLQLDHKYILTWSLLLDLKIIASTIPAVVKGQGGTVVPKPAREESARSDAGSPADAEPQLVAVDAIHAIGGWPVRELNE